MTPADKGRAAEVAGRPVIYIHGRPYEDPAFPEEERRMNRNDLIQKRSLLGWTQKDAAAALGVSVAQIAAMENGRSGITNTIEILLSFYRFPDRPGRPSGFDTREPDR